MNTLKTSLLMLSLSLFFVSACGFQLRGQANLPVAMQQTSITGISQRSELFKSLSLILEGNGMSVTDAFSSDAASSAKLNIGRNDLVRDVLAVGANSEIREFVLNYDVSFSLLDADGQKLIEPQVLSMQREFTFDNDQLLSAASEEEFLRKEMTRSMARRILDQITLLSQ